MVSKLALACQIKSQSTPQCEKRIHIHAMPMPKWRSGGTPIRALRTQNTMLNKEHTMLLDCCSSPTNKNTSFVLWSVLNHRIFSVLFASSYLAIVHPKMPILCAIPVCCRLLFCILSASSYLFILHHPESM